LAVCRLVMMDAACALIGLPEGAADGVLVLAIVGVATGVLVGVLIAGAGVLTVVVGA
jgi:hypothetical protein